MLGFRHGVSKYIHDSLLSRELQQGDSVIVFLPEGTSALERVCLDTVEVNYHFLHCVLKCSPTAPPDKLIIRGAFEEVDAQASYALSGSECMSMYWAEEEATKLHMVWGYVWACHLRTPLGSKSTALRRLKYILHEAHEARVREAGALEPQGASAHEDEDKDDDADPGDEEEIPIKDDDADPGDEEEIPIEDDDADPGDEEEILIDDEYPELDDRDYVDVLASDEEYPIDPGRLDDMFVEPGHPARWLARVLKRPAAAASVCKRPGAACPQAFTRRRLTKKQPPGQEEENVGKKKQKKVCSVELSDMTLSSKRKTDRGKTSWQIFMTAKCEAGSATNVACQLSPKKLNMPHATVQNVLWQTMNLANAYLTMNTPNTMETCKALVLAARDEALAEVKYT